MRGAAGAGVVLGSAALGAAMGWALHLAVRTTKAAHQYQLALVIGAVMMTVGAALVLKLSALFAPPSSAQNTITTAVITSTSPCAPAKMRPAAA